MFDDNQQVLVIGSFRVKDIKDGYIELDPFEKGHVESTIDYQQNGFAEINEDGTAKAFDGWQVGDFFKLQGTFDVERSNGIFTKLRVGNDLVSIPNHKLMEVIA